FRASQSHNAFHFLDTHSNALLPSMAVLCCVILAFLTYQHTTLCAEDKNVTSNVNKTARDTNITASARDEGFNPTDHGISLVSTDFPVPTAWTGSSTESSENYVPSESPESPRVATAVTFPPLLVSGALPVPVTDVLKLCPCDLQGGHCELNCCCDVDCTDERFLFTHCSLQKVSNDARRCVQESAVYSLSSTPDGFTKVESSVQKELSADILCIQSANYKEGLSFATPEVPTEENFDSLFGRFLVYFFGRLSVSNELQDAGNASGYKYGDVIQTVNKDGELEVFIFPASAVTTHCSDSNPAGFLMDQTSRCMRSFDLIRDCTTLQTLSLRGYTNFTIRSVKNQEAMIIGVDVVTITLQSLEGTKTPADLADSEIYVPKLIKSGEICNNVVFQVKYTIKYSDAGEILNVIAAFTLGAVKSAMVPIQQEFQIVFLQETSGPVGLKFSGNPGYVLGRSLVAGTRTAEYPFRNCIYRTVLDWCFTGIVRLADPEGSLTVLQPSVDQDCLFGAFRRSPVLFGIDMVSGCTLRLSDGVNCSLVSEVILWALKGQIFPDHVASFGNSSPQKPMDWVAIQNQTIASGTQACSIPLSYHLEVKWTKYGTLLNPQAQILSVVETIKTNTSSLDFLTGAGGLVSVTSSVSFVDVAASATSGFKAPPTIDAKLPFDFFFPFV
ncbi:hypothetical protein DNTS_015432, partial [Danionella cerebrum]